MPTELDTRITLEAVLSQIDSPFCQQEFIRVSLPLLRQPGGVSLLLDVAAKRLQNPIAKQAFKLVLMRCQKRVWVKLLWAIATDRKALNHLRYAFRKTQRQETAGAR